MDTKTEKFYDAVGRDAHAYLDHEQDVPAYRDPTFNHMMTDSRPLVAATTRFPPIFNCCGQWRWKQLYYLGPSSEEMERSKKSPWIGRRVRIGKRPKCALFASKCARGSWRSSSGGVRTETRSGNSPATRTGGSWCGWGRRRPARDPLATRATAKRSSPSWHTARRGA
ncbi:hypothetical protein LX36DRAFT_663328 [Colletotrichum falcatum]|nr:hypothetical protein LX36DRAFT_663328 [Colletotrichum falcatum]